VENQEIECRFLEIDKDALIEKLRSLGARDLGEQLLEETIIYDGAGEWLKGPANRFIRVRRAGDTTKVSYKEHREHTVDGTLEVEFAVSDYAKAIQLFEAVGFKAYRRQEKRRHTLLLDDVMFDIDTWPKIPTYVEFEGASEKALKDAAQKVGYNWSDANFHDAAWVIEHKYGIPIKTLERFTFDRVE
jgi:adenylate cyclase, class 2